MDELKEERVAAKQVMKQKSQQLRNFTKKVDRGKEKAKKMSDNGLVHENLHARATAKEKRVAAKKSKGT